VHSQPTETHAASLTEKMQESYVSSHTWKPLELVRSNNNSRDACQTRNIPPIPSSTFLTPSQTSHVSARLVYDFSYVQMFSSHLYLTRLSYLQGHPIVHQLHIHYVKSLHLHCLHLLDIIVFQLSCLCYIVTRASSGKCCRHGEMHS
jgi:hypothetical protein